MKIRLAIMASVLVAITGLELSASLAAQAELVQAKTACGSKVTEKFFETQNYFVYICRRTSSELTLIGSSKSSNKSFQLPASYNPQNDTYIAHGGNTDYFVNSNRLLVYRDGRQFVSELVTSVSML